MRVCLPEECQDLFWGEKFELISTFKKTNFFITFSTSGATTFHQLAVLHGQSKNEKTANNIAIRGTNYLLTLGTIVIKLFCE